jgi:hypothetical protein
VASPSRVPEYARLGLWESNDHGSGRVVRNCGHKLDCHSAFPLRLKSKYKANMTLIDIGDVGFEFEYAGWMAKDEYPGVADSHGAIKLHANARIADIAA